MKVRVLVENMKRRNKVKSRKRALFAVRYSPQGLLHTSLFAVIYSQAGA